MSNTVVLDGFVRCPVCKSGKFTPCMTPSGKERVREGPHIARIKLAEKKGFTGSLLKASKPVYLLKLVGKKHR